MSGSVNSGVPIFTFRSISAHLPDHTDNPPGLIDAVVADALVKAVRGLLEELGDQRGRGFRDADLAGFALGVDQLDGERNHRRVHLRGVYRHGALAEVIFDEVHVLAAASAGDGVREAQADVHVATAFRLAAGMTLPSERGCHVFWSIVQETAVSGRTLVQLRNVKFITRPGSGWKGVVPTMTG